ncbi:MAG TPA: MAPEG family protein [Pseudolabrys sp.]|uniref:MAPEG family protein n=1 Tax=Pseudolabrys sp. TaxID=1960880 RepID=UPI002DDD8D00|nr:MAPEG family protein [Pseudolabrys sp.]HEV2628806.1 MAPEG family protein [Pseudolabrys sp.]
MTIRFVLLPLFVEVLLTFGLYFWMAWLRTSLIRSRAVHPRDIALREPNWPPHVLQVANAAHNQLELPLLFYVLTILSIMTHHADVIFIVLAWIFVLSRLAHAWVHTTSNRISVRGPVFGLGLLVLLIMWLIFIIRILTGLP